MLGLQSWAEPSETSVPTPNSLVLLTCCFCLQVEVLTSLKALSHHVDPGQLPTALEGPFPYCHSEWVRFFQVSTVIAFSPVPSLLLAFPSLPWPVDPSTP